MKRQTGKIISILLPLSILVSGIFSSQTALAQTNRYVPPDRPELIYKPRGNFSNSIARPLRYWPDGTDFVITNGAELFNRPLYSMNSGLSPPSMRKAEFRQ